MPWPNYTLQPSGGDSSNFVDLEATVAADYNTNGGSSPVTITLYKGNYGNGDDGYPGNVNFTGWATQPSASNPVSIAPVEADKPNGTHKSGFYMTSDLNTFAITNVTNIHVDQLDCECVATISNRAAILASGTVTGARITNCIGTIPNSGLSTNYVFNVAGVTERFYNNVAIGGGVGYYPNGPARTLQNCAAYDFGITGYTAASSTNKTLINCQAFGSGTGFKTGFLGSNNASGDASAEGANSQINVSTAAGVNFVNYAGGDYRPTSTGVLNKSSGLDQSGVFNIDIEGNARDGWTISPWNEAGGAPSAPTIDTQPQPVTVTEPAPASFTTAATDALSSQWYKGTPGSETLLPGETGDTLTINPTAVADSGTYFNRYTNATGDTDTNTALLTVNAAVTTPGIFPDDVAITGLYADDAPITAVYADDVLIWEP